MVRTRGHALPGAVMVMAALAVVAAAAGTRDRRLEARDLRPPDTEPIVARMAARLR